MPEGFVFSNFLRSGQSRVLTYVGGDGNDIALKVLDPAFPSRIGDLDNQFGRHGVAAKAFAGAEYSTDIALHANGKIVAVGLASGDFGVAQFLSDGSVDTSFGADWIRENDFGKTDLANAVAVDAAGNIFVVGTSMTHQLVGLHLRNITHRVFWIQLLVQVVWLPRRVWRRYPERRHHCRRQDRCGRLFVREHSLGYTRL